MKGHTGGTMSMGKGSIYNVSAAQKLDSHSSTKAELIGVRDVVPQALWSAYILTAQGQESNDNVMYQGNTGSILLETNGHASTSSKCTHHINIQYFHVKDHVDKAQVSTVPTSISRPSGGIRELLDWHSV